MIGKSIGLNNRRARRATDRALRRKGLPPTTVSPEKVRGRAIALTDYLRDADPALLRRLNLDREESHAALLYIADVAGTMAELQRIEPGEKVDLIGFRNFRSDDFTRCQREMVATMMRSPGIDPLEHYVLAWQAHEQPTPQQVHRAAQLFLDVMGLGENQAMYAAHSNTANYHLHIAANRVHPTTFARTAAGGDWQVDMIHQAIAMIEHEQGWASEPNALYRATERGVFHNATGIQVRDADRSTGRYPTREQRASARERSAAKKEKLPIEEQLSEGALAYERRTGVASFERLAKTVVKPIVRTARSWPELHQRLAEEGFGYEPGGSGARIRWGERTLAASVADRSAAFKQMEARKGFGPFVDRNPLIAVIERPPSALTTGRNAIGYEEERAVHRAAVQALKADLQAQRSAAEQGLIAIRDGVTADIDAVGWRGAGAGLNVARGVAGHLHRQLTTTVAEQFRQTAGALAALDSFPSLQAWMAGAPTPVVPASTDLAAPAMMMSPGHGDAPLAIDLPGYRRVAVGRAYHHLDRDGRVMLRDLGDLVIVDQARDKEAVRLALLLARTKWDTVAIVSGDAAFRTLCARIALEEGIVLTNRQSTGPSPAARMPPPLVSPPTLPVETDRKPVVTPASPPAATALEAQRDADNGGDGGGSIYGDFPFLHERPTNDGRPSPHPFAGLDPLVDAWLTTNAKDPQDFSRLRPLASRIMQDTAALDLVGQMAAEGIAEADRIAQQARFQQSRVAAAQQAFLQR